MTTKKIKYQTLSMDIDTNTAGVQSADFSLDAGYATVDGIMALLRSGTSTFSVSVRDANLVYFEDTHSLLFEPSKNIPQDARFLKADIPAKKNLLTVQVTWLGAIAAGTEKFQMVCRLVN